MAQYEIKFNQENGWSYQEEKIPVEAGYVELSEAEVQILVDLMKQQNTYDVSELSLEESYPNIFEKLDDTCSSIAYDIALSSSIVAPSSLFSILTILSRIESTRSITSNVATFFI